MTQTKWHIMAATAALQLFTVPLLMGQEFRMETDIFVGEEKDPAVQTLTIFADGVVYDFLRTGDEEIAIFDHQRGNLVLMDTRRQIKTTLSSDSILGFVAQLKGHLLQRQQNWLVDPEFVSSFDEESGWLNLTSDNLTYRVKGSQPTEAEAVPAYQQFADWYARLNAMRAGNVPPFARIELNQAVAERNWLPETVERVVTVGRGVNATEQKVRSQHLVNWRLSHNDRKLIDRAGTARATYRDVRFTDYIEVPEVAGR